MSLTAGARLSGLRGNAPQTSDVQPILRLRVCADPGEGSAAAPAAARTVVVNSRRDRLVMGGLRSVGSIQSYVVSLSRQSES